LLCIHIQYSNVYLPRDQHSTRSPYPTLLWRTRDPVPFPLSLLFCFHYCTSPTTTNIIINNNNNNNNSQTNIMNTDFAMFWTTHGPRQWCSKGCLVQQ
jgi:hypothetical protein